MNGFELFAIDNRKLFAAAAPELADAGPAVQEW